MVTIRIPKIFYNDHRDRDLPSPVVVNESKSHYWIDASDHDISELLSDATYYSTSVGWSEQWDSIRGLVYSARATVKALSVKSI
jgi:hypothetical protein